MENKMLRKIFMNKPDEENWVKFRFWIPKRQMSTLSEPSAENDESDDVSKNHTEKQLIGASIGKEAQGNVGHVSIETINIYASLWPNDDDGIGLRTKHDPLFITSPEVDIRLEGREPDYEITLYTLNAKAIEDKFNELKTQTKYWSLLGKGKNENSCASQTLALSQAGGLTRMDPLYPAHAGVMYVSPPSMFNLIARYKQLELKQFPETEGYGATIEEFNIVDNPNHAPGNT